MDTYLQNLVVSCLALLYYGLFYVWYKQGIKIMKVSKKSNKPFKSGSKINTVRGTVINPYTNKPAFVFFEDNSIVDQYICIAINYRR
jgi:hypothetical protein